MRCRNLFSDAPTSEAEPSTDVSTSPSATPGSASPNPSQKATNAVLASYDKFWAAQVNSQASPQKRPDPGLARYSIDKALADAQATIFLFRKNGIEMRGRAGSHESHRFSIARHEGVGTGSPGITLRPRVSKRRRRPVHSLHCFGRLEAQ